MRARSTIALRAAAGCAALVALAVCRPAFACVGDGCINLYSSEDGGGQLTTTWDFATRKVQTFRSFCGETTCLFSAIDPGFIPGAEPLPDGFHALEGGAPISIEVVARDAAVRFRLNGEDLEPGESGLIGTTPDLHNHPSWQLSVPPGTEGDFPLTFRLTTSSATYEDSETYTILITNRATPTPDEATPTATPTATALVSACAGDCGGDGTVTINELIAGVAAALGQRAPCAAQDLDGNGTVSINELIAAVNAALVGCAAGPTPTATLPATLARIQETIFSPRCAIQPCHNAQTAANALVLDADSARAELVGVDPFIDTAREAGLKLVDPGRPENSFLLIKLEGPPPDQGSRMPQIGDPLTPDEIALIRAWIAAGAP